MCRLLAVGDLLGAPGLQENVCILHPVGERLLQVAAITGVWPLQTLRFSETHH